jgi:hypothetical protein
MQTAWRPLDSVTGYFRGVVMLVNNIYNNLNYGSRPCPLQSGRCKLNQNKLNLARAAAIITGSIETQPPEGNGQPDNGLHWKRAHRLINWGAFALCLGSHGAGGGGLRAPLPFLFFEFNFFIYLPGARLITGKDFKKPRPLFFKKRFSMESWVKFFRKSIENGWLKNHKLWVFWSYCLLKATHKRHKVIVGFQEIELMPGQFVFGLKKASKDLRMSMQSIRTCLTFLKKSQNITIKSTNKFSLITVVNWEFYQSVKYENNKQTNKQLTNKQQTTNKQLTTYKNGKKGKNENNKDENNKDEKNRKEEWLKMVDKHIGKELSISKKSDLIKIKEILDDPTYKRLLLILKEKNTKEDLT